MPTVLLVPAHLAVPASLASILTVEYAQHVALAVQHVLMQTYAQYVMQAHMLSLKRLVQLAVLTAIRVPATPCARRVTLAIFFPVLLVQLVAPVVIRVPVLYHVIKVVAKLVTFTRQALVSLVHLTATLALLVEHAHREVVLLGMLMSVQLRHVQLVDQIVHLVQLMVQLYAIPMAAMLITCMILLQKHVEFATHSANHSCVQLMVKLYVTRTCATFVTLTQVLLSNVLNVHQTACGVK